MGALISTIAALTVSCGAAEAQQSITQFIGQTRWINSISGIGISVCDEPFDVDCSHVNNGKFTVDDGVQQKYQSGSYVHELPNFSYHVTFADGRTGYIGEIEL
jgi:hypothetical protein